MKMLLVFPPQWNPTSVYLSVPLLTSQLRAAGYDAESLDLNVKFFNRILRSEYLLDVIDGCVETYGKLSRLISEKYPDAAENFGSYSLREQTMFLKFRRMHEMLSSSGADELIETAKKVDSAVSVLRNEEEFYIPEKLFAAKKTILQALKVASLPFAPNEIIFDNYFSNPLMKQDWVNIDSQCKDREVNMFIDFFEECAGEIAEKGYDFIGISVPDLSQLIPAFTLARILKAATGAKICIGGNYITQNMRDFMNHPEIFGEYVDFLSVGDGETSIIEVARFISGEIAVTEVSNVVYPGSDGKACFTFESKKLNFENVAYLNLDQYDFSEYFSPEPVLPIQLSKGCYWGKCSFCDYYYGQQCFDIKDITSVIDEFRYYIEKYGIRRFSFIDEAIPPKYYLKLAQAIIDEGLDICYYSFARLEKEFTEDAMSLLYKSGARILLWGYEAYSERVLGLMNKGINAGTREEILRNAHNAGIWNNALFIIGYPTETREEIEMTLDFVRNNRDIVNSCTPSNFSLKKNALLHETVGTGGIISCKTNGEFYTVCIDEIEGVPQHIRRDIRRDFHLELITDYSGSIWPVNYSDFDLLLLYLSKYTCDYVANYKSEENLTLMFR